MFVKIMEKGTNKVVEVVNKEPVSMREAEKIESGVFLKLNHEKYYVDIFQS